MAEDLESGCPVCYENFKNEDVERIPRRLACLHVVCTGCLTDLFDDGEICCPLCFEMEACESVEYLPALEVTTNVENAEPEPPPPPAPSATAALPGRRPSKLGSFLSSNPNSANSGPSSPLVQKKPGSDIRIVNKLLGNAKPIEEKSAKHMADQFKRTDLESALGDDAFDPQADEFDPQELAERFRQQRRMQLGEAMSLIQRAKEAFSEEPNLLELTPHLTGKIHAMNTIFSNTDLTFMPNSGRRHSRAILGPAKHNSH